MKVGVGATSLQRGILSTGQIDGIGTYTQQLVNNYRQHNNSFCQVVFPSFGNKFSHAPQTEIFSSSFERNILLSSILNCAFSGSNKLSKKIDLFHATDHYIPKFTKIPVIATIMDAVPLIHPEWGSQKYRKLKNWLFYRSAHWAQRYISISEFAANDIASSFHIKRELISVIPLGVNEIFFQSMGELKIDSILEKYSLTRGKFFLFIGTLQPRKNLRNIIAAFKALPEDIQESYPLVIVGKYGWGVDTEVFELKALAEKGKAKWLGYIDTEEKRVLLKTANSLIFPSLYEGFGLPIIEAFASGLPVITSNTSALPEIAQDAALLIEPMSSDQINHAMMKLIYSSELRSQLRSKGQERAQYYTWDKTAQRTWEIYETMG